MTINFCPAVLLRLLCVLSLLIRLFFFSGLSCGLVSRMVWFGSDGWSMRNAALISLCLVYTRRAPPRTLPFCAAACVRKSFAWTRLCSTAPATMCACSILLPSPDCGLLLLSLCRLCSRRYAFVFLLWAGSDRRYETPGVTGRLCVLPSCLPFSCLLFALLYLHCAKMCRYTVFLFYSVYTHCHVGIPDRLLSGLPSLPFNAHVFPLT
jgi:hypothetical protein